MKRSKRKKRTHKLRGKEPSRGFRKTKVAPAAAYRASLSSVWSIV